MPFEIDNECKKRQRRGAKDIMRLYKCPVDGCSKSYGMEGTLNQHIKIKHNDYYNQMMESSNGNSVKEDCE